MNADHPSHSVDFISTIHYHPQMRFKVKITTWPRWLLLGMVMMAIMAFMVVLFLSNSKNDAKPPVRQTPVAHEQTRDPHSQMEFREVQVRSGDTFETLCLQLGLSRLDALAVIDELRKVFDPRRLRSGQTVRLIRNDPAHFRLEYEIDTFNELIVERSLTSVLQAKLENKEICLKRQVIRGRISYSLFDAIAALGERDELADRLAALFEYDVDFNRDLRRDDRFALLVDKQYVAGEFVGYGQIHAAYLLNDGREILLGRHTLKDQTSGYFHPGGDAVEKFFLKCPLPFMRLTSRFGSRRHPVLGFSAQHTGIDLGAPVGTSVRSTATGRVRRVGRDGVRGLFVEVTHPNGYETHYYHLSSLSSATRAGAAVSQGQVIAFVGNSGRSTGPHLHYGIRKAGRFINPLSLKTPPRRHLPADELERFRTRLSLHSLILALGDSVLQSCLTTRDWLVLFANWLGAAENPVSSGL
jgi:murein DD-endopeptidase MepM/ murein hydrolase activator NlpD